MFEIIYSCEELFPSMNYRIPVNRNKLKTGFTAKCFKQMNTEYETNIMNPPENKQHTFSIIYTSINFIINTHICNHAY